MARIYHFCLLLVQKSHDERGAVMACYLMVSCRVNGARLSFTQNNTETARRPSELACARPLSLWPR